MSNAEIAIPNNPADTNTVTASTIINVNDGTVNAIKEVAGITLSKPIIIDPTAQAATNAITYNTKIGDLPMNTVIIRGEASSSSSSSPTPATNNIYMSTIMAKGSATSLATVGAVGNPGGAGVIGARGTNVPVAFGGSRRRATKKNKRRNSRIRN